MLLLCAFFLQVSAASVASAETRTLKLYFLHTGEKAEITFKRNGKYISSGLRKINRFLRDWRRNEPTKMDPRLLDLVWEIYKETGSRKHIHVISAYRSPATNKLLRKRGRGVAKKSQHTLGKALDFFIPGVSLRKLRNIGLKKGLGGVGFYPKSGSPFVHMDTGRVRHWPKMSRRELARVFPKGKTLHVPSDGKPLPRYNQAKAEYERKISGRDRIVVAKAEEIEKKPGFFAKLLGRGGEEEDDVSAVSAPKPVVTTTTAPQATPPPATPESIIASLSSSAVPVPFAAPRVTVSPTLAEAEIPTDTDLQPIEEETSEIQIAAAIPIRAPRSELVAEPFAVADQDVPVPGEAVDPIDKPQIQSPIVTAALSPVEIEDLRRKVYSAIATGREDVPSVSENRTDPFEEELVIARVDDAGEPQAGGSNKLSILPTANPRVNAIEAIETQVATPDPIETGTRTTDEIAVPRTSPREIEQIITALPLEPDVKTTGDIALPVRNPLPRVAESVIASNDNADVPVPLPAARQILVASADPVADRSNDRSTRTQSTSNSLNQLEGLKSADLNNGKVGKWAFATNASISEIAEINPPAYARNIIRERPSTVLTEGFNPNNWSLRTDRFSGSSLEFLNFTRFN